MLNLHKFKTNMYEFTLKENTDFSFYFIESMLDGITVKEITRDTIAIPFRFIFLN